MQSITVRRRRTEMDFANTMHAVWKDAPPHQCMDKQCQCTNLLLYETLYGFPPRSDRRRTIPSSAVANAPLMETSNTQTTHGHAIDEAIVLSDSDISSQCMGLWFWTGAHAWGICSVLFLYEGCVLPTGWNLNTPCTMCSLRTVPRCRGSQIPEN